MDAGADFVNAIAALESGTADKLEIGDKTFVQHKGTVVEHRALLWRPAAQVLKLETLTGLLDYAAQQKEEGAALASILVASPTIVGLLCKRRDDLQTPYFAEACVTPRDWFDKKLNQTDAVIALQTECLDTDSRAAIIQMISRLEVKDSFETQDDGVSTRVTIQKSAGTNAIVNVQPFHELKVRLTFAEIEQPTRRLLMRLQKQGLDASVTFHEADGKGWELEVKRAIKEFLVAGLAARSLTLPVLA